MKDPQHRDFNELLHNFIISDEKIKIIKVAEMDCNADVSRADITLTDWVSQAMGSKGE